MIFCVVQIHTDLCHEGNYSKGGGWLRRTRMGLERLHFTEGGGLGVGNTLQLNQTID